jgi:predicted DCC family thiol-disulfide oxidoreductase YuxK
VYFKGARSIPAMRGPVACRQAAAHDGAVANQDDQPKMIKTPPRPVLFYDGGCPLCRREIAHYRRLDRDGALEWVDLLAAPERLRQVGLDTRQAMARLHVIDVDGRLISGVAGFVAIWRRLPYYRHLARVVTGLGLLRPLDWAYSHFAARRFRSRCKAGVCGVG